MTWLIDVLAAIGGLLVCAGVFLQFGLGFSLMSGGLLLIAFALKAAKVQEGLNVSNKQ